MRDPYAVLGVSRDAEMVVIEAAYRALMKKYHPDRTSGQEAERRSREINAAYDILKDPTLRAAYDASTRQEEPDEDQAASPGPPVRAKVDWTSVLRSEPALVGGLTLLALLGLFAIRQGSPGEIAADAPSTVGIEAPPPAPATPRPSPTDVPPPAEPPAQPALPTSLTGLTLTTDGLGPIRIGMSRREVEEQVGPLVVNHESGDCASLSPRIADYVELLIESGRVTRVSVSGEPSIRTPRGVGAGSRARDVRAAYGPTLLEEPHVYMEPPAMYLTFLIEGGSPGEGVRFEADENEVVTAVHGGQGSLGYVEGCL